MNIEKYKLENGLEVIFSVDHRLPVVAVNIWYHVGPANEKAGRTGFAHLFEHMMFQGSKHVGPEPFKVLETAGATQVNGTTGFDRTNYFETMPADRLELALWFESDRMAFLLDTLTARNLANQRDVVRNERRQGENRPYKLVQEELFRQLFPSGHPYHGSIIGSHADIESVCLADIHEFCKQYYVPNNATLALAGDFDPAHAKHLIEKYFGPIPAGSRVQKPDVHTPPIVAAKHVTVTDTVELSRIYKTWLTAPMFKPGDAEADVLAHILGGGASSRLYQRMVNGEQIAQDANAGNRSMMLGSVFIMVATAKPGVPLEKLERALDEELTALKTNGPTQDELDRVKNLIQTEFVLGLEQPGGFSGVADRLNTYNHYLGDPDYFAQDLARYEAVTPASVQRLAQSLTPDSSVTVFGVPGEKVLHDVPKRTDIEVDLDHAPKLTGFEWRSVAPGASNVTLPEVPAHRAFTLSNGFEVLVLEQHHVPAVSAAFVALAGTGANPARLPGLASFTTGMLMRGTNSRSQLEISQEAERLGARLSVHSNADSSAVHLEALKKNADRAFELLADVVRNPAFLPGELERLRAERITAISQLRDDPTRIAEIAFAAELYGTQHPYGYLNIGVEASNKAISSDDLMEFHRSFFAPEGAGLVICGDLDETEARSLAEKHFGGWHGNMSNVPSLGAAPDGAGRVILIDRPGSPQTQLVVGQVGFTRRDEDYVALELLDTILGGMFSSRININLREVHGYTYGARSRFSYRRAPGPFSISAAVRTDASASAVVEVFREIEKLQQHPAEPQELAIAKEYLARSVISQFQTIGSSTNALSELFVYGLDVDAHRTAVEKIASVTLDEVHRAANRLTRESMTVVVVGDVSKIEKNLHELVLEPFKMPLVKS
ncbi:MAG TPA: pitrilysin family protein [Terracidiphilus sp.]|nr:pitrilysin family protein [Terracidiphilus sp.]